MENLTYQVPANRINLIHQVYNTYKVEVQDNVILIETWHGLAASGEPFEFAKELSKKNSKYRIYVTALNNLSAINIYDHGFEAVMFGSEKYYKIHKVAKYKFISANIVDGVPKTENQIVIQMWHGFPTKQMVSDLNDTNQAYIQKRDTYQRVELWDYLTISSNWYDKLISSAFALEEHKNVKKISLTPYRINNLIKSSNDSRVVKNIRSKYVINKNLQNKKIILLSPTWRSFATPTQMFNMKFLLDNLEDYVFIVKLHPNDSKAINLYKDVHERMIIFYNEMVDINELYLISDIMISDYSSAIFDYMVLNKPVIIHNPDSALYDKNIGLYFKIEEECKNIDVGNYSEVDIIYLVKKFEKESVNYDDFTNRLFDKKNYIDPEEFLEVVGDKNGINR